MELLVVAESSSELERLAWRILSTRQWRWRFLKQEDLISVGVEMEEECEASG